MVGPPWGYVGASWRYVGPSWGYVGAMLGHLGAMLGPGVPPPKTACWPDGGPVDHVQTMRYRVFFHVFAFGDKIWPNIAPRWPNIAPRWPNIAPT